MAYKRNEPAKGCPEGYMIKTVCLFDDETHAEVRTMAERKNTSFAEQVRILVDMGIETMKEIEKGEG